MKTWNNIYRKAVLTISLSSLTFIVCAQNEVPHQDSLQHALLIQRGVVKDTTYENYASGEFTPAQIAGGIYTKMITSAAGLIIGLLAYVAHNYLMTQVDKTANKMEASSAEFLDILQEPTR